LRFDVDAGDVSAVFTGQVTVGASQAATDVQNPLAFGFKSGDQAVDQVRAARRHEAFAPDHFQQLDHGVVVFNFVAHGIFRFKDNQLTDSATVVSRLQILNTLVKETRAHRGV